MNKNIKKVILVLFIFLACGNGTTKEVLEITTSTSTSTSTTTNVDAASASTLADIMPAVVITCEPVTSDSKGFITFNFEVKAGTNDLVVVNIVSWFDSTRTDDLFIYDGLPEPIKSNNFGYTVDNNFSQYEIEIVVMDSKDNFANDYCLFVKKSTVSSTVTTVAPSSTTTTLTQTTTTTVSDYPQLIISEVSNSIPDYNRNEWNHWIDKNSDCQNTRHEVLIEESEEIVTYTSDTHCSVSTGKWFGYYTGQYYYNASELDIDHFIPLKNAHESGGYSWSLSKKEDFANYRLDPDNLIAVSISANRSKGAKGPDEWKPLNTSYWCQYAYDWIRIKEFWSLTATQAEWEALVSMIATCPESFKYGDAQQEPIAELPMPTTTTTTVGSSQPANPGNSKNCGDFSNYAEAKAWFDTYYPFYGDIGDLDRDEDLIPCESLSGAP